MSKSLYAGYSTLYSEKYKNKRIGQCTDSKGDTCCPKCKDGKKVQFVAEHEQMGFGGVNKYQEFNVCSECGTRFCIVMVRKDVVYGL